MRMFCPVFLAIMAFCTTLMAEEKELRKECVSQSKGADEPQNFIKNPSFEEFSDKSIAAGWILKDQNILPTDMEIVLETAEDKVISGKSSLRIDRYNENSNPLPVAQNVSVECSEGDVVRFGCKVVCEDDLGSGGETLLYVSVYDGKRKVNINGSYVGKNGGQKSEGEYRFKFGGKIRYLAISFRPLKAKEQQGKTIMARGKFVYDDFYLNVVKNKSSEEQNNEK